MKRRRRLSASLIGVDEWVGSPPVECPPWSMVLGQWARVVEFCEIYRSPFGWRKHGERTERDGTGDSFWASVRLVFRDSIPVDRIAQFPMIRCYAGLSKNTRLIYTKKIKWNVSLKAYGAYPKNVSNFVLTFSNSIHFSDTTQMIKRIKSYFGNIGDDSKSLRVIFILTSYYPILLIDLIKAKDATFLSIIMRR